MNHQVFVGSIMTAQSVNVWLRWQTLHPTKFLIILLLWNRKCNSCCSDTVIAQFNSSRGSIDVRGIIWMFHSSFLLPNAVLCVTVSSAQKFHYPTTFVTTTIASWHVVPWEPRRHVTYYVLFCHAEAETSLWVVIILHITRAGARGQNRPSQSHPPSKIFFSEMCSRPSTDSPWHMLLWLIHDWRSFGVCREVESYFFSYFWALIFANANLTLLCFEIEQIRDHFTILNTPHIAW